MDGAVPVTTHLFLLVVPLLVLVLTVAHFAARRRREP
jgi:ABC-type uncharacterized transport system involved in gliding motility auxiliary subunit